MEGFMKISKILIVLCCWSLQQAILASDDEPESPNNWKVTFFREYLDGHKKLKSPTHPDVAKVLSDSFDKAAAEAPEADKEVVEIIGDQVRFFVSLQDPQIIEQEMEKCRKGMKEANSWYARIAPDCLKGNRFVQAFCDECKKRRGQ